MKAIFPVLFVAPLVFASCSMPQFFSGSAGNSCACDDWSGKYGQKWEKCGEILKEKIGKQWYYGELEVSKVPAYYSKDCR